MAKRRVGSYPTAFRRMAVDRLRKCDNVVALSEELGVRRRLLYKRRQQLERVIAHLATLTLVIFLGEAQSGGFARKLALTFPWNPGLSGL